MRFGTTVGVSVVASAAMLLPTAAQADTTYRYWSYWTGGEQWSYSARGPGFRIPPDTGVEGWRFVVSPRDGSQAAAPAAASDYAQLCPSSPLPPAGQKRVAVVVDAGAPGIAPVGQTPPPLSVSCLTVPESATGLQVLQRVGRLRFAPSGLICGIAGFPATECPGQTARTSSPPPVAPAPAATLPPPPPPVATPTPRPAQDTPAPRTPSPTPTRSAATPAPAFDQPSPVALPLGAAQEPASAASPPAWIAAIGAAMIAALLGLALLARRGRR